MQGAPHYDWCVPTYLDQILVAHRREAALDTRSSAELSREALSRTDSRNFHGALQGPQVSVIAEIKRRSPSKGDLAPSIDAAALAQTYKMGGASALSVLTDSQFFGGSFADLESARRSIDLPLLRKDFTVSVNDVLDAKIQGADAVLLIVAALDDRELREFHTVAVDVGLSALVEVHDEIEVERALAAGASIIGVNQRDLHTFKVDTSRAQRVAQSIPSSVLAVAESGVRTGADAAELASAGFNAVLVGEHLVTADSPEQALHAMTGHHVGERKGANS